jgi:hypothetical protein
MEGWKNYDSFNPELAGIIKKRLQKGDFEGWTVNVYFT